MKLRLLQSQESLGHSCFNFVRGLGVSVFLNISLDHYYTFIWGVGSKMSPGHYFGCDNLRLCLTEHVHVVEYFLS